MNKHLNYTGSDIKILDDIDAIRKYPGMYIGETTNPNHLFYEVINNAVDETMMGFCDKIMIEILNNSKILVRDNGRGIPIDSHSSGLLTCQIVFLKNHSGGKFNAGAYSKSGGLHGIGLVAVNALCKTLKVKIRRSNSICIMSFSKGKCTECNVHNISENEDNNTEDTHENNNYTEIVLEPDDTIFESNEFDFKEIINRIYHIAALNKNLTITIINNVDNTTTDINVKDGIVFLLDKKIESKMLKHNICLDDTMVSVEVEAYFNWCNVTKDENITAFTNCILQPEGGSHIQGMKAGIVKFLSELKEIQNVTYKDLLWQDIKQGFKAVINIKIQNPKFTSQSKQKLVSHDVRRAVEKITYNKLQRIYKEYSNYLQEIINRTIKVLILKQGDDKTNGNISALLYDGKLMDCTTKNRESAELYIAEGESAGGTIKPVLNRKYQAVLSIRGKILNVEKANTRQILASEILAVIIKAVGGTFDMHGNTIFTNIRYGKIIILVDADVDGSHIRALLLTLFYRNMIEIITQGRLYIAVPPLYSIKTKHTNQYLQKRSELNNFIYETIFNLKLPLVKLNSKQEQIVKELIEIIYAGHVQNEFEAIIADIMIKRNIHTFVSLYDNFAYIQDDIHKNKSEMTCYLNNNDHIVIENFYNMTKMIFNEDSVSRIYNHIVYGILTFYDTAMKQISDKIYKEYSEGIIYMLYKHVISIDEDVDIQRFKGLGEMNQDQIYNTVVNEKTRIFKKVTLTMVKEADKLCSILMGSDAKHRRDFIINNYHYTHMDNV